MIIPCFYLAGTWVSFLIFLTFDVFNLFAVSFITEAGSLSSPRLLDGSSTLSSFDISSADMIRLRSPCVCGSSFHGLFQ